MIQSAQERDSASYLCQVTNRDELNEMIVVSDTCLVRFLMRGCFFASNVRVSECGLGVMTRLLLDLGDEAAAGTRHGNNGGVRPGSLAPGGGRTLTRGEMHYSVATLICNE